MGFVVPNALGSVESSVRLSDVMNGGPLQHNMSVPGGQSWASPSYTNLRHPNEIQSPVDSWHALITLDSMTPVVAEFLSETWLTLDHKGQTLAQLPLFHIVREHCPLP